MKKISVLIILLTFFCLSCEDKNIFNFNSFDGYTSRNFEGFLVGSEDTDDWNLNDDWKRKEQSFFDDYDQFTYDCEIDTTIEIKALPNPTSQYVYFSMIKDTTIKFDYRVVNEEWEVLASEDDITSNNFYFDIVKLLTDESIVRIYYRLKVDDNCAYIGHGDIKIQ